MRFFLTWSVILVAIYFTNLIFPTDKYTFFDRKHTSILKGIGITTVLWCHSGRGFGINGIQWIAAIGVGLFLFLSGYGLTCSYYHSKLKNFWKKRFVSVFIPYWIVYMVLSTIWKEPLNVKLKILTIVMSPQWYISYIFVCYAFYWLIVKMLKRMNLGVAYSLVAFFIIWLIIDSIWFPTPDAPYLRTRQMLCFPGGVLIGILYNEKRYNISTIESRLLQKKVVCSIAVLISCLFSTVILGIIQGKISSNFPNVVMEIISVWTVIPFVVAIVCISIMFPRMLCSKILNYLGLISFDIYLVQYYFQRIIIAEDVNSFMFYWILSIGVASLLYPIRKALTKKWE